MHGLENSVVNIVEMGNSGRDLLPAPEPLHRFKAGALNVEIHSDHESASRAAANDAARTLTRLGETADVFGVLFATGASQIGTQEADFEDPLDVKTVHLDTVCRQQQASEGWFGSLDDVPKTAITVTIPALFRVPKLVLTVLGPGKATAVKDLVQGPISTRCPASILRLHRDATVYLDQEAAAYVLA